MTIQDLKDNREEIISIITEECGAEKVAEVMKIMVNGLDCNDNLDELIEGTIAIFGYEAPRRKITKTATLLGKLEQLEIENN